MSAMFYVYSLSLTPTREKSKIRFDKYGTQIGGVTLYEANLIGEYTMTADNLIDAIAVAKAAGVRNPIVEYANAQLRETHLARVRRADAAQALNPLQF